MAICYDGVGRRYACNGSGWYNWGRWVLLGVIIVFFALIFFLFSCITARRRRRAGHRPMYGTGWAAAGPLNPQPSYQPNYNQQPAPSYNATPSQGGYYGQNQSYFGGQQTGVEQPQQAYQPPSGPPPGKNY